MKHNTKIIEKNHFYTTTVLNKQVSEKLNSYCTKYGLSKSGMIRLLINLGVDHDILSITTNEHIKNINSSGENHE